MLKLRGNYVKVIVLMVIIVVSILSLWFGLRAFLKTDYPLMAVNSVNMEPTLQFGDLIVVQGGLNGSEIKAAPKPEGDIIVFHKPSDPNDLVIGRAVDNFSFGNIWYFSISVDRNNGSDDWVGGQYWEVSMQDIVGRVVGRVPLLGYVLLFMQWIFWTPTGMLIIIALILIFSLYTRRPSLRKKVEAQNQDQNQAFINNSYMKSDILIKGCSSAEG